MSQAATTTGTAANKGVQFLEPASYVLPTAALRLLLKLLVQQADGPGKRKSHRSERPAS